MDNNIYNSKQNNSKLIFENIKKNKLENNNNGINIINNNINTKEKYSNYMKDITGDTKNYNNYINTSFNMNSIDHLFYKPIKNKSPLVKSNLQLKNKNISDIITNNNSIKDKKKYLTKLNTSFSVGKNNNIKKKYNNIKTMENSLNTKNHSSLNIGSNNIKNKFNLKLDDLEKNYKKKMTKNSFQPKNIFSKYKTKKNQNINQEELLQKKIFLIKSSHENKNNRKKLNYNNFINELEFEENNKKKDINSNSKKKEIKLDEYNNNSKVNSEKIIPNLKDKQINQINNYNILSSTTLMTGTDKQNNISRNIINELNTYHNNSNINNSIFKGKKIRCIHDISKTGLSGEDKKVNQDRYFIFRNFVSGFDNIFMGVLDGHGYYGHEVSEYIKENLPMDLNRVLKSKNLNLIKDDLSEVIKQTFEMENNSLLRNKKIDSNLSGSTCISVIYTPEKLIIANLGDSRCILGKKINNEYSIEYLSKDHKPSVPEEAERIKKYGGRIRPMMDEEGNFIGPLRVYMKERDIPGLAMTRSFGDYYASTAGTISIPEIGEYKLGYADKFLILASDGLFEFISCEEIVNIVSGYYENNDIVGCCEFLYKESYRKWISEEEDIVDDITIILVFFED